MACDSYFVGVEIAIALNEVRSGVFLQSWREGYSPTALLKVTSQFLVVLYGGSLYIFLVDTGVTEEHSFLGLKWRC